MFVNTNLKLLFLSLFFLKKQLAKDLDFFKVKYVSEIIDEVKIIFRIM